MEITAVMAIAYRDLLKFLRDPARMVATFVFPVIFMPLRNGPNSVQAAPPVITGGCTSP